MLSKQEITQKKDNEVLQIENPDQEIIQMSIDDRIIKPRQIEEANDQSVVDIDLIYCHHCERSYAPETFRRFCQKVDENGVPKCLSMRNKKRKVFNSAKVSFFSLNEVSSILQISYMLLVYMIDENKKQQSIDERRATGCYNW
jgi:hypothetical protein